MVNSSEKFARVCLCGAQLLTLMSDLFTEDLCSVVLRAFCGVDDDDCSSDFNVCLTRIVEKVCTFDATL